MRSMGFEIDSMHTFTDLRGGQEDTGDQQVLVVWITRWKEFRSYYVTAQEDIRRVCHMNRTDQT